MKKLLLLLVPILFLTGCGNQEKEESTKCPEPEILEFKDVSVPYDEFDKCVGTCQNLYNLRAEKYDDNKNEAILDLDFAYSCKQECQSEWFRVIGNAQCIN